MRCWPSGPVAAHGADRRRRPGIRHARRVSVSDAGEDDLALIARYYDACSSGDADGVSATTTADVVHYFLAPNPGSTPVRGGEHLGRYWRKVHG